MPVSARTYRCDCGIEASGVVLPGSRGRESLRVALHQWRRSDVVGVPTASFILHQSSGVFRRRQMTTTF